MRKKRRGPFFLFLFLGPGLLAALADNDSGGILSYTVTGARFGWAVFVPLTLGMVLITYTVQEMAMRLGVVAGAGYTGLLRKRWGTGWMVYQVVSLFTENLLTLLTEFVGMSAGLELLGLPRAAAVLLSAGLALSLALFSGYRAKERFGLAIGLFNFAFLFFALFAKPQISAADSLKMCGGWDFRWYAAALAGNAIAPWMIFYQSSAYVDKGGRKLKLRGGRLDTIIGCVCQVAVAAALIMIGSSLAGMVPDIENAGVTEVAAAIAQRFGVPAGVLFALGLFDSGLLAAVTVSLSSSWSVAEAFGWAKSLNDKIREAPGFYAVYGVSVCLAAVGALIPGLRRNQVAVFVQVAGGIMMVPILFFLILLASSREVMGEYASTRGQKIRAWICAGLLTALCAFTFLPAAL